MKTVGVSDAVRYDIDGGIVVITINRPERGNALSRVVREGLFSAWRRFEADPDARVAILTGAGDRVFCAGADLGEMAQDGAGAPDANWVPILGANMTVSKPTIAAVNGFAVGGGFLQMHMCDLVVASSTARLGITEARVGRGSPWALPLFKSLPTRLLMELLLTAQPITAQRAYELGLANLVVEPTHLLPAARRLAAAMIANAPLSLAAAKQMRHIADTVTDHAEAQELTDAAYRSVYASRDAQIGPAAFLDRRTPVWTGT